MVRDAAYQSRTPDFWASCDGLGGPATYRLWGTSADGKGEPGSDQRRQPRLSAGALPQRHGAEHGGGLMMLTRDEALEDLRDRAGARQGGGRRGRQPSRCRSSVESHARFADNRITTSGRSEDLDITATVWVGRRRGSVTGNDAGAEALEADGRRSGADRPRVAGASRVRADARPARVSRGARLRRRDRRTSISPRAPRRSTPCSPRAAPRRSPAPAFTRARASAIAAATANGNRRYFRSSEAGLSVTARSADGTGSGYFAGDHFDLARLDTPSASPSRRSARRCARERRSRSSPASIPVILEPQAVADLIGFLTSSFDARTADEGRSAFSGKGRQDATSASSCSTSGSSCTAIRCTPRCRRRRAPPKASRRRGCRSSRAACSRTSSTRASGRRSASASRRRGRSTTSWRARQPAPSIDEMIKGMERGLVISRFWYVRLVDPRTIVLTGLTRDGLWWVENGRDQPPGAQPALQPERAGDAGAVERRGHRRARSGCRR